MNLRATTRDIISLVEQQTGYPVQVIDDPDLQTMTTQQIQTLAFEIALLGNDGLDINDPEPRYQLRSLPGDFSALQLVATMYAAFQQFAPEQDLGIDLSREYEAALALSGA